MAVERPKGMAGSAFLLPEAGGTHPWAALQLPNTLPASIRLSFPQTAQTTLLRAEPVGGADINQYKPKQLEAMASLHHNLLLY